MSTQIPVPDRVAERVTALANAQGRDLEEVAGELLDKAMPIDPEAYARAKARFGFIGMAGSGRSDGSTSYKQQRREHFADRSARDA